MDLPIVVEQMYDAPVEKVWQALTDQDTMKIWYFPQLKKYEPVVGFDMEFNDDGSSFKKHWQVTQVLNRRKLAHTWTYKGYPGYSEVVFEIFKKGKKTKLKLTHTGLSSFPPDSHFARHRFEDGWNWIIKDKLKHYLE